jgi:hypothetical protein
MRKERLLHNTDGFILKIDNLLWFSKDVARWENIKEWEKCFEEVKELYFKNIRKYLKIRSTLDNRRMKFESVLKWNSITVWIWEWYLQDMLGLLRQFRYEIDWMSSAEYNKFLEWLKIDNNNYWKLWNPLYWIIEWLYWLWWHKIISTIIWFIILTILTAIVTDSVKPITDIFSKPIANSLSWSLSK